VIALAGSGKRTPCLEDAVRDETLDGHPLPVATMRDISPAAVGQILFVGRSAALSMHSSRLRPAEIIGAATR
jgi:hypothetical protein